MRHSGWVLFNATLSGMYAEVSTKKNVETKVDKEKKPSAKPFKSMPAAKIAKKVSKK